MSASKAQRAAVAERRAKAIALRRAGLDWQAIADRLGYSSRGAACQDVTRAMRKALKEEAGEAELLRYQTVERYDRLQAAFWSRALGGDPKAADVVLKCIAGRARIEGTEAPARVSVDAQQLGDEILALIRRSAEGGVPGQQA